MCMGEIRGVKVPLSRGFEAPVREDRNTSTVPRFFFLSMVRLPWCDGEEIGPGSRQHQHRSDAPDKFTSVAGGFRMFQTSCDMSIPYPNNWMTGAPIPQLQLADFRGTTTTDQLEFDFEPLRFEFSST